MFALPERPDTFALLTPWWSRARVVPPAASLRPGERADELEYELPGGSFALLLDLVLRPFLGRMFAYRHAIRRRSVSAVPLVRSAPA